MCIDGARNLESCWSAIGMNIRASRIRAPKPVQPFDFKHPSFLAHDRKIQILLKRAYRTGMSEDSFVQHYKEITDAKGQAIRNLRNYYRHLQKKYNFFTLL